MTTLDNSKPTVFISYSHHDGEEFTRWLALALSIYMDVFWDRNLGATDFNHQLFQEIETRDYFILVMSPRSLSSEWCKKELKHAEARKKGIALAKITSSEDKELVQKYSYADFTRGIDIGFKRLTMMLLNTPYLPWEYQAQLNNTALLEQLKNGLVLGRIAKELVEQVIIEQLWKPLRNKLNEIKVKEFSFLLLGNPQTPKGVIEACQHLEQQFLQQRPTNHSALWLLREIRKLCEIYQQEIYPLAETNHIELGRESFRLIEQITKLLELESTASRDFVELYQLQTFTSHDVAEKLRQIIQTQARASRYLY